jgi:O-acetyl-ADP-ribose deacetylase (regulator of RNase III)
VPPARRLQHRRGEDHRGYRLPARHVIHTVGPVWARRTAARTRSRQLLCAVPRARQAHGLRSVAFAAISTGVYGFRPTVARIAVGTVADALAGDSHFAKVVFCCFTPASAEHHREARRLLGV